jgi:hypothetical protein
VLLACAPPAPIPIGGGLRGERDTFAEELWDDGNAEVASYRAIERRYGTLREGHATLILVKETFDAGTLVKDDEDNATERLDVIKLNHIVAIPTGVYTYRQMASVFLAREDARAVKLVTSSQEWCGITYKRMVVRGGRGSLHTSSYFGAEAERSFDIAMGDRTVLFDALPAFVRTLNPRRRHTRRIQLVPQQLSNRAAIPHVEAATVTVGAPQPIAVPAGRFSAYPVTVEHAGGREVFHLAVEAPHPLIRWDRSDGGAYELEWMRRAPYWELHDIEDVHALDRPAP